MRRPHLKRHVAQTSLLSGLLCTSHCMRHPPTTAPLLVPVYPSKTKAMLRRSLVAPSGNFTYIDYINIPASAVQIEARTHPQGHFLLLAPIFSFVRFPTAVGQAAITSRANTRTPVQRRDVDPLGEGQAIPKQICSRLRRVHCRME
uniref:Putative secreted protein n=1 Tax=Ixodes ricinus TaxID=34613 RepID=A0A6B0UUD9_IXORI